MMLQHMETPVSNICGLGVPCGRLDGYSAKGEVSHSCKKHGVEAAKSIYKAESRWPLC